MPSVRQFLKQHRAELLSRVRNDVARPEQCPHNREYVKDVVAEFLALPEQARVRPPSEHERAFWYTLYVLEEISELVCDDAAAPHLPFLLARLRTAKNALRRNLALPSGHFANRPGEAVRQEWKPYAGPYSEAGSPGATRSMRCDDGGLEVRSLPNVRSAGADVRTR
mgnify:CR=1 FL=1